MTACRNKARGAVVAALAGALTLGAAPVMALAVDGAGLMATDVEAAIAGEVAYSGGESGATFTYNGEEQGLEATTLTPEGTGVDPIELTYTTANNPNQEDGGYFYFYVKLGETGGTNTFPADSGVTYRDSKGVEQKVAGEIVAKPSAIGDYAVVTGHYDGTDWQFVDEAAVFYIKGQSLDNAALFEDDDVSDTTFTYDGKAKTVAEWKARIGVAVEGVKLDPDTDYDLEIWAVGGTDALEDDVELKPDTTYAVKVLGKEISQTYGGQKAEKSFSFGKLDLSKATIVTNSGSTRPQDNALTTIVKSVNGVDSSDIDAGDFAVTFKSGPNGSTVTDRGEYTYTVSASKNDDGKESDYVTGSQDVTYVWANKQASVDFSECGTPGSADSEYVVDLSKDKPDYFDLSKVKVTYDTTTEVSSDDYAVSVTDEDGNAASADDLKTPGTWVVKVTVNYKDDSGLIVAGSGSATVKVSYGEVEASQVYVSFDGKNVPSSGFATPYTGEDMLDGIAVKAVKGDKTFEQGTDYDVKVTLDGKEVDEIVDAGPYKVSVSGKTFSADLTFDFTVSKRELTQLVPASPFAVEDVAATDDEDAYKVYYLAYTGEELAPEYAFKDDDGNEWALAADEYEVTYVEGELKDEGDYTIAKVEVDAKNFKAATAGIKTPNAGDVIRVTANRVFADVPNDEYYTDAVAVAKQQGYVFGMGGTNLFMPNSSISRADMAVILYRMAGGVTSEDWSASETDTAFLSQYADVDAKAYYAQALAWATRTGIVSGYEDGNFGPADAVTVEQFVTMLARYAKVVGNYEAVDTDEVLSGVADGSQVSEFGQDAVAWAIESGYLAQGGADIQPQSPVTRGRAITIAVRYQPAKASLI